MSTTEEILTLAKTCGFTHVGELKMEALEFLPAVRDMCSADRCQKYGRSWTCPPGCGTLEEAAAKAARYHRGVLLQTTAQLEDDFDIETMQQAEADQKQSFLTFVEQLRQEHNVTIAAVDEATGQHKSYSLEKSKKRVKCRQSSICCNKAYM